MSIEQVTVPEELGEATTDQLLYLALACDSGGDVLASGIDGVLVDLEGLYVALGAEGEHWAADMLHQAQTRLRIIRELARRRVEAYRAPATLRAGPGAGPAVERYSEEMPVSEACPRS